MSVKERILQLIEYQDISKEKFFRDIGYSAGNFRGKNLNKQIGSDVLVTIVTKFNVNAHWLLTGEGEMFRGNLSVNEPLLDYKVDNTDKIIKLLESQVRDKEVIIELLKRENDNLRKTVPKASYEKQTRAGGDR